ncbi:THO complex subunit 4A-like [Impatiens glandulifera]|uniref:THO complex subunit 4A-like n=1 Tax=Impatiens glandulifera TaxID=253017 RepID=UPI001FB0DEB9|nr:THO complex subunit 4A-like [Impatiens glandulifera]
MLNMNKSLDDFIKRNKQLKLRQVPNSGEPGPARRLQNRSANRAVPYSLRQVPVPDAASPAQTVRVPSKETGTKLIISNLNYGVSDKDIMEIFSDVGKVQRYSINYDRSGRSKGTAEVVYSLRRDAEEAMMRYQGVRLDGKRMKVETVGTKMAIPVASIPIKNMYQNQNYAPISCHGGRASGIGNTTTAVVVTVVDGLVEEEEVVMKSQKSCH